MIFELQPQVGFDTKGLPLGIYRLPVIKTGNRPLDLPSHLLGMSHRM
jgi:hypothetical protein